MGYRLILSTAQLARQNSAYFLCYYHFFRFDIVCRYCLYDQEYIY